MKIWCQDVHQIYGFMQTLTRYLVLIVILMTELFSNRHRLSWSQTGYSLYNSYSRACNTKTCFIIREVVTDLNLSIAITLFGSNTFLGLLIIISMYLQTAKNMHLRLMLPWRVTLISKHQSPFSYPFHTLKKFYKT